MERVGNTELPSQSEPGHSERLSRSNDFLVWQPSIFLAVSDQIESLGRRDCPVLIRAEAGTAKETVARQIHAHSKRAAKTFIPTNCSVLKGPILESQLFGQERDSSRSRTTPSLGAFRAADGGTLFLDEVDKLAPDIQSKILRVMQQQRVQPVGSNQSYAVDVRVICAADKDLRQEVQKGNFLADLYFSVNVATLALAPLRERPEDIVILARYFLDQHAQMYNEPPKKILPAAMKVLTDYNWPGNVRELANVVERAFIKSRTDKINSSDLPAEIFTAAVLPQPHQEFPPLEEVDKKLVIQALRKTSGKKMAAARLLRIDHRRLNRLIKKFDLNLSLYKHS